MRIVPFASLLIVIPVAACGANPAPTDNEVTADTANAVAGAITNVAAPASPTADHVFTGKYELTPAQDDTTVTIARTGAQRYKVSASWGGFTAGGNYNSDGWEGMGEAHGDVLSINRENTGACRFRLLGGAKALYRMEGCGGGYGNYHRVGGLPQTVSKADEIGAPLSRAALFGAWAYVETRCASDSGLFLNRDGTWGRNGHSGPWSLSGNALRLVTTELFEDGEDAQAVNPPTTEPYTVTRVSASRLTLTDPQGGVERYMRCK